MRVLFFYLLLGVEVVSFAKNTDPAWFTQAQTGSYSGLLSLGGGYQSQYYSTSASLGYVPESVADEDLWSLSLRGFLYTPELETFGHVNDLYFYAGLNVIISLFDSDTWIIQPSQYPARYYPANGIRTAPYFGAEKHFGKLSVFFEVTMLDLYLEIYQRSQGLVDIEDLINFGFGIKYYFES